MYKNRLFETTALIIPIAGMFICSDPVQAGPTGGTAVVGVAGIVSEGSTTTITQTTAKSVINWQSFDTVSGETVHFIQPSSDSITLNRINNGAPTRFDGNLLANGNVWIVNSNGVFFGANSTIDVAGLIASTADITDSNFNAGNYRFDIAGAPDASVINDGSVTIREAGLAGFVAPNIENNGFIRAFLGKVQLNAGDTATLDLYGDGLIELAVTNEDTAKTIIQNGIISADGGTVILKAAAGKEIVDNIIMTDGIIQADTIEEKEGKIILSAEGGKTEIYGTLSASGNDSNETGGAITVTGDEVIIKNTADIDVSGNQGGGTIRIGGGWQGGENIYGSDFTSVEAGAVIKADATENGDGGSVAIWSDGNTDFDGHISAKGGEVSGDGGSVEVSGKGMLGFSGTVDTTAAKGETGSLLLDPTDITISNAADSNVAGTTTKTPSGSDLVSNVNVTTLQTLLASSNVTVQTLATGSQSGNITVSDAVTWGGTRTLTLNAANDVIVNAAINGIGLTLTAGNDVKINANLTGTGNLTIQQSNFASTVGIGTGQTGTFNLDDTELAHLINGWNAIYVGSGAATGNMNIGAAGWHDPITFRSNSGVINVNGTQTVDASTNLTFNTNADVVVNADLTGSGGTLYITPATVSNSIGVGSGQAGTIQLSDTELTHIVNGWGQIQFGGSGITGNINAGTATWNDNVTFRTSGIVTFNGDQNFGSNSLSLQISNDPVINGNLNGTGTFSLNAASVSIGFGDGQTGTITFSDADIAKLNGWSSTSLTGTAINIGSRTWTGALNLTATGITTFNGAQNFGSNDITMTLADDLVINNTITGTGDLTIQQSGAESIGMGTGQTGEISISDASVAFLTAPSWSSFTIGQTNGAGNLNFGAIDWHNSVTANARTGAVSFNGAQNFGSNSITVNAGSAISINDDFTGTGTASFRTYLTAQTMGIGSGQTGDVTISDASLNNITDGWSNITFLTTAAMNIGYGSAFKDNVTFRTSTGVMTVAGISATAGNNITLTTDANPVINGPISGSGTLTIQPYTNATTIGLGDGRTGTLNLTDAELNNISDGWNSVVFGYTSGAGAINIGTRSWNDSISFKSNSGIITVEGAQNFGANNATFETNVNPAINAALTGSGNLTFRTVSLSTSIGTTGTVNLSTTEIGRFTDGWNNITIGRSDGTAALVMAGPITWNDNVTFMTGSGLITVSGGHNFGSNNFTIQTDSALAVTAALTGTGTLTILPSSTTTSIGIAGGTGTLNLTTTEMNYFTNGWSDIIIGRTDLTGVVTVNAMTVNDPFTILSNGVLNLDGVITSNAGGTGTVVTLASDSIVNTAGASAIDTGTGRFLLYTANPAGNTLGGLTSGFHRYSCTYGGSCPSIPAVGNGFLYSYTPYLTVTPDSLTAITYGDTIPNLNGYSYSVSGYLAGDSGNDTVTGTINGSTSYTTSSNAGASYNIDYSSGTLTSSLGYGFTYADNASAFAVNKATVTATADNKTRTYGNANPAFTVSYSGLKNGETSAVIDTLATASSTADTSSAVGSYSVIASGALDNNYSFTYVNGTLTVTAPSVTPPVVVTPTVPKTAVAESIRNNTEKEIIQTRHASDASSGIPETTAQAVKLINSDNPDKYHKLHPQQWDSRFLYRDMVIIFDPTNGFDFRKADEYF